MSWAKSPYSFFKQSNFIQHIWNSVKTFPFFLMSIKSYKLIGRHWILTFLRNGFKIAKIFLLEGFWKKLENYVLKLLKFYRSLLLLRMLRVGFSPSTQNHVSPLWQQSFWFSWPAPRRTTTPTKMRRIGAAPGINAIDFQCSYLILSKFSWINASQVVFCLWLISRAINVCFWKYCPVL